MIRHGPTCHRAAATLLWPTPLHVPVPPGSCVAAAIAVSSTAAAAPAPTRGGANRATRKPVQPPRTAARGDLDPQIPIARLAHRGFLHWRVSYAKKRPKPFTAPDINVQLARSRKPSFVHRAGDGTPVVGLYELAIADRATLPTHRLRGMLPASDTHDTNKESCLCPAERTTCPAECG